MVVETSIYMISIIENVSLPCGIGTRIRQNTRHTKENTPRSNKTQHTKLHKKWRTTDNEYTANTINKKLSILCYTQIIR
jgi:penicillin V acylase-like amidase (Ntn superfamily)